MSDRPGGPRSDVFRPLQGFLDLSTNPAERAWVLNNDKVSDRVRAAFIRALDPALRLEALEFCDHREILAEWARDGSEAERFTVAANDQTDYETLLLLAHDDSALVRRAVVLSYSPCVEALVLLREDASIEVQSAFDVLSERHAEMFEPVDNLPGGEESLDFLYAMVAAAEAEDRFEQLRDDEARECAEQLARELQFAGSGAVEIDELSSSDELHDEAEGLDDSQVLALLRHVLGARPI